MCDTSPLAAVGRARPPFIRSVRAPRATTQLARSFSGKFRPWRDATLASDRQMTHSADVAPSLAVALLAASLTRRPSLTRRVCAVRPPTRRVSEGGIVVSETTRLLASNSTCEVRCVSRAKKYDQPSSTWTKCDPRRESEFFPGGKGFPGEAGNDFLIEGAGDARERFWTGATAKSAQNAQCWDGTTSPDIGVFVPLSQSRQRPDQDSVRIKTVRVWVANQAS
jgi:hypothetical protein